jgi:hypothetical protein
MKKVREEDEISSVMGIWSPTPIDSEKPASYIHRFSGVVKILLEKVWNRQILPYNIGTPTPTTIVDYVDRLVMRIPEYWRDLPGMVLYMSTFWFDAYQKDREAKLGVMPTYDPEKITVARHENIRIVVMPFLNDSNLMFITTNDNICRLEYFEKERSVISLEMLKRTIYGIGDYKKGMHIMAVGRNAVSSSAG